MLCEEERKGRERQGKARQGKERPRERRGRKGKRGEIDGLKSRTKLGVDIL